MEVTLYTIHCPHCKTIERMLKQQNIEYTEIEDQEIMREKGFRSCPMLVVDGGEPMDFSAARKWIQSQKGKSE